MKTQTKARLWFLLACVLAVAWFIWGIQLTEASERRGNNDDVNVDVDNVVNVGGDTVNVGGDTINVGGSTLTGGDVSVPVNVSAPSTSTMHNEAKSLALGNVLGDVDIADCLGSHQWNTPIFGRQDLKLNQVCMAEFYLSAGKYQLAAMSLCNIKEILREFENEEECEAAHDFTPPPVAAAPSRALEEEVAQLRWEQAALQSQIVEQQALLERAESKPAPRPVVVQQEFVTDEKRAKIKALFAGDDGEESE